MIDLLHKLYVLLGPAWAMVAAAIASAGGLGVVAGTVANIFRDPDNNPATPPPKWVQLLDVLALVAAKGHVGLGNTRLSVPGMKSKKPRAPKVKNPLVPAIAFALLACHLAACTGYRECQVEPKRSTAQCRLVNNLVKCGEGAGMSLVPIVVGIIGDLIAGKPFDPQGLVLDLERQGVKNIPCVLAALEDYLMAPNPLAAQRLNAAVVYAFQRKGIWGDIDVKLNSGRVLRFAVPNTPGGGSQR